MRTKAAILTEINQDLIVDEIELPRLQNGQVLVRLYYSGICGTQLAEISGKKGPDKWLPHCLGHEGVGIVLDVGSNVSKVKVDDEVILSWIESEGINAGGSSYKWGDRIVNAGPVTTLQQYAVVSENRVFKKPESASQIASVLLGCAALTGVGSINNVLKVKKNQTVAIWGSGGVGLCACIGCLQHEPERLVVIDTSEQRLTLAKSLSTRIEVVNATSSNFYDVLEDKLGGGADYVVEATGSTEVFEDILRFLKPKGGRAVIVGNAQHGSIVPVMLSHFNEGKSLMGTWGGDSQPGDDVQKVASMMINFEQQINNMFCEPQPIEKINEVVKSMTAGTIGRGLIKFD